MISLTKEKTKVKLRKYSKYSYDSFLKKLKKKACSSDDFMDEFMEGPYFHLDNFRGPWTWLCSFGIASMLLFVVLPLLVPVMRYIEDVLNMDTVIVAMISVVIIFFLLTIITQFLATWIRRKYKL